MTKEKGKNYLYFFILLLFATWCGVSIWNKSQEIIDNTVIAVVGINLGNAHKSIVIESPNALDMVENPIHIKGKASSKWYFEAVFPVKIVDEDNNILGQGPATASSDWTGNKMVPFDAVIPFQKGLAKKGFVIFSQDDPSGIGDVVSVKIPVSFEANSADCQISGCSSEICSDTSVPSTCEYKEEYKCFSFAKCERQKSGQCGWTETTEYKNCLKDIKSK